MMKIMIRIEMMFKLEPVNGPDDHVIANYVRVSKPMVPSSKYFR